MKNFTLAEINRTIPYIPALRPFIGSVTACILMQQLDYWFSTKDGKPFYKFLDKQKSEKPHPAYKLGDSLCEELFISSDECRCAFDKIGCKYKSFTEFKKAREIGDVFQGRYYASYHDKIRGLTWYFRNHELVDALLFEIFMRKSRKPIYVNGLSPSTEIDKAHLPKLGKSIQNITEITTEITTENTTTINKTTVVDPLVTPDNQTFSALFDLIPSAEHSMRLIKSVSAALDAHDKDYVDSNIKYCLLKHKADEGNSLGGMIVEALSSDYAKSIRSKIAEQADAKARIEQERKLQEEQERLRIETKTAEDRRWCETEEGKAFAKLLFIDDS